MTLPCDNMNLNLYRVFYTVAKTKSFSESSRTLHISQPAISKHIQNLEYELNTLLFYRTNRGIELTKEAKDLLIYVEKAYNYLMLGERELQEGKELTKGTISIGVPTFINEYYLSKYIKKFMKEHPNIVIKMINQESKNLLDLFNQHSLDLLLIPDSNLSSKDIKNSIFNKDEYCFAYNKDVFKKINIKPDSISSLEEIFKNPVILPTKNSKMRIYLEELLKTKIIASNPILELEDMSMLISYTIEGLGIGYIPKSIALSKKELTIISLEEKLYEENIHLIYNETVLTNSSKELIHILMKEKC